jgi:hypothetical protein
MMKRIVHRITMPKSIRNLAAPLKPLSAAIALTTVSLNSHAISFNTGDISIDWDSTFTYGLQYRLQERDDSIALGSDGSDGKLDAFPTVIDNAFILNGNDGNNSFNRGLTANRFSILSEADINAGNWGVFVRGKIYYDALYADNQSDMTEVAYSSFNANPKFHTWGGYTAELGEYNPGAVDYMKMDARFLDIFLYGSIDITDTHYMQLRVGRQVISWGEALMSGGGLATSINRLDSQIRSMPGLEIKELFLPTGSIYASFNLSDTWNLEAYYQYEWNPHILDPNSTFMSEFDSIGDGGDTFIFVSGDETSVFGHGLNIDSDGDNIGDDYPVGSDLAHQASLLQRFLPRDDCQLGERCNTLVSRKLMDIYPSDQGQFGLSLKHFFDNGDEMGFYFVNYHERIPSFILPLTVANDYAPLIDFLIGAIDPERYEEYKKDSGKQYESIEDLGSSLSLKQLNVLLDFFYAVPAEGGTVVDILNNFIPAYVGSNFGGGVQAVFESVWGDGLTSQNFDTIIPVLATLGIMPTDLTDGLYADNWVDSLNYRLQYFDNIRMWGVTYSTIVGDANVAAELSYKENAPILRGNVARTPDRQEVVQLNANAIFVLEPAELFGIQLWDFSNVTAEFVSWYLPGRKDFDVTDMQNPDRLAVQNTRTGLGYAFLWTLEYKAVTQGLDIIVPIYFNQGVDGAMFTSGFRNGQSTLATGITAKYLGNMELSLGLATNFGDKDDIFQRLTHDRDNVSLAFKYAF